LPEFLNSFVNSGAWQSFLDSDREAQLSSAMRYFASTGDLNARAWCVANRSLGRLGRFLGNPNEAETSFYFPTLDDGSRLIQSRFHEGVPIAFARYTGGVALDWMPVPSPEAGDNYETVVRLGRFVVTSRVQVESDYGMIGSSYNFQKLC
jgi:hypothetical protein